MPNGNLDFFGELMYRKVSIEITGELPMDCISPAELAIHKGAYAILDNCGVSEFVKVLDWKEINEEMPTVKDTPILLRQATLQDQAKADENKLHSKMARKTCEKVVAELAPTVHLIRVRYDFNRKVLHIIFTAESNPELGDVIKTLATELKVRIDMTQIGVRDESKIIGGIGPCGRVLCCCSFIEKFESINVKMAKAQQVSLNPSSMSGMCDRLKCCLGYEYEQYREAGKNLPNNGTFVETPDGAGVVISTNIMPQEVTVQLDDNRIITYHIDDIRISNKRKNRKRNK